MATYGSAVRRGLPRRKGGEPWPPAGDVPVAAASTAGAPVTGAEPTPVAEPTLVAEPAPVAASVTSSHSLRRGLPRVPGGESWPPASAVAAAAAPTPTPTPAPVAERAEASAPVAAAVVSDPSAGLGSETVAAPTASDRALRRGLPRVAGREPWPPEGFAPELPAAVEIAASAPAPSETDQASTAVPVAEGMLVAASVPSAELVPAAPSGLRPPLPFTRTAFPGVARDSRPAERAQPVSTDLRTTLHRPPWPIAISGIFGALALLILAALAVLFVRWFLSLEFMQEFLTTYPGESHLPDTAPVGIPAWLAWQHFFNTFFMVLIIRTGLQVRNDKRPGAFWTPRWSKNGRGKISLSLWFHQSLDVLWFTNGVVFIVLLFTTGQWMRVVPTTWEVIPNAISAALQYVSLDWPTENGWVNYNSLQVLAYFVTIFIAAPLAAITGVRMSGLWPKDAARLNKAYPIEWARAVHFPVMLYFVVFIIVHVTLVLATGALRNLNHMYGGQDAINWAGFWIFIGSLIVIAAAWIAARPLVLAPIAKVSGKVSAR